MQSFNESRKCVPEKAIWSIKTTVPIQTVKLFAALWSFIDQIEIDIPKQGKFRFSEDVRN